MLLFMDALPLATVAHLTADEFRRGRETIISVALATELANRVEIALLTTVRAERRACVAECTRRAARWRGTAEKPDVGERARIEAQHRGNEAHHIGDLIEMRTPGAQAPPLIAAATTNRGGHRH
jgi:hypothetical protein